MNDPNEYMALLELRRDNANVCNNVRNPFLKRKCDLLVRIKLIEMCNLRPESERDFNPKPSWT